MHTARRLGILARHDDATALHLQARAHARGDLAVILDAIAGPVAWTPGGFTVAGHAVESLDALYVHRLPGPTTRTLTGDPLVRTLEQRERHSLGRALVHDAWARGVVVVNPLDVTLPFDHKPHQLATFARIGLPIPRTIISDDINVVRAFVAVVGEAIAKPVSGGAPTVLLDAAALQRFSVRVPCIVQERMRGADVRVLVVDDRVVACARIESDAVDPRALPNWDTLPLVPHVLPDDVIALCVRAAQACGHVVSGLDFKWSGARYALLEANSAPVFLDVERACGVSVTDAILDAIAARI